MCDAKSKDFIVGCHRSFSKENNYIEQVYCFNDDAIKIGRFVSNFRFFAPCAYALSPLTRDCKFPNIGSAYASMKKDDVVNHRVPGKLVAISNPEKTGELRV